jgi:preprotein translocase subunit SecD
MRRVAFLFTLALVLGSQATAWSQDKTPGSSKKLPAGVYAVLRDGLKEKDVLPLKEGEALVVHEYRFLKKEANQPPRFLVVRAVPDVTLDLANEPKVIKAGDEVVGILLKLQPKAAKALEQLTKDHVDKEVAIIVGGEVVTTHKIRTVITGGDVQITSCAPKAAGYLLEQLQALHKKQ